MSDRPAHDPPRGRGSHTAGSLGGGGRAPALEQDFAVQVAADNVGELNYDQIILLLKKAMGANYDRQSSGY